MLLAHLLTTIARLLRPGGVRAVVAENVLLSKHRNPRFGCRRIAQQIAKAFGINIDKDVVGRVLAKHDRPVHGEGGPSWLTFIGHRKDSPLERGFVRVRVDIHDPLLEFHRWHANLRILGVEEIKTVPYAPRSHPS